MHSTTNRKKPALTVIYSCFLVFGLGLLYLAITITGLAANMLPGQPTGQPWFSIMEMLILLIIPLMTVCMAGLHYYTSGENKIMSLAAVCFILLVTGITCAVHFVILTVIRGPSMNMPAFDFFFSFRWPSVVYSPDILAWDFFFPLSMLFAATTFNAKGLPGLIRILMITAGVLSFAGLAGLPTGNMQVRNIGIAGYGFPGPVIFLLAGITLQRARIGK